MPVFIFVLCRLDDKFLGTKKAFCLKYHQWPLGENVRSWRQSSLQFLKCFYGSEPQCVQYACQTVSRDLLDKWFSCRWARVTRDCTALKSFISVFVPHPVLNYIAKLQYRPDKPRRSESDAAALIRHPPVTTEVFSLFVGHGDPTN